MEAELQRFRQKKLAEERKDKIKENIKRTWENVTSKLASAVLPESERNNSDEDELTEERSSGVRGQRIDRRPTTSNSKTDAENDPTDEDSSRSRTLTYAIVALKFLMWGCLWMGFIKIGFGAVFFAISMFYFIWVNMDSGKRRRGQKSAYSVFNENCEAIDGTLNAEMLEKNLLYRTPMKSD